MGGVINHATRHTNHLRHALAGPYLTAAAIGLGGGRREVIDDAEPAGRLAELVSATG